MSPRRSTDRTTPWASSGRKRHDELDAGTLDPVLRAVQTHAAANDEARKSVNYVERFGDFWERRSAAREAAT